MKSDTIGKLAEAMAKAQKEMQHATKDSNNPHFKSKYADLASVIDAVREPLSNHGLSFVQYGEDQDGAMFLVTRLMHTSGEFIEGRIKLLTDKPNMQGLGSALTYARRYGLAAMMGIHQEDDDGNASVGPKPSGEKPRISAPITKEPVGQFSDKQKQFYKDLVARTGVSQIEIASMLAKYNATKPSDLTKKQFSDLLDELTKLEAPQVGFEEMPMDSRLIINPNDSEF